jgi:hypothetical protein
MDKNKFLNVYLFEALSLHVLVISEDGTLLGEQWLQWNGRELEPVSSSAGSVQNPSTHGSRPEECDGAVT